MIKYILSEQSLLENKKKPCTVAGCSSTFSSVSNLNMHLEKHHGIQVSKLVDKQSEVQYFCPVTKCKYNVLQNGSSQFFKLRKYVRQHFLKVHAVKNQQCSKCDKNFANQSLKSLHERSCGMLFKCMDCEWEYTTRECLLTHCRRKRHRVPPKPAKPKPAKSIDVIPNQVDQICRNAMKSSEVRITLKNEQKEEPIKYEDQTDASIRKVQSISKNSPAAKIRANFQRILQRSKTISGTKVSQTTQTISTKTKRIAVKKMDEDSRGATAVVESKSNDKYKSLELIDEESNSSTEDSAKANRNLNNLSYVEDESSLHYFTVNNVGLCHIETQTDLLHFEETNIGSNDMDPLFCHMHTQTSDDILTELGLADIQTQTNWPNDECNDLFVSTETQTCFDSHLMMDNISTHTQTSIGTTCDSGTRSSSSKWLNSIQHHSQFTQTFD